MINLFLNSSYAVQDLATRVLVENGLLRPEVSVHSRVVWYTCAFSNTELRLRR